MKFLFWVTLSGLVMMGILFVAAQWALGGERVELGCVSGCNMFDRDNIDNPFGAGNMFRKENNPFSEYRNPFGPYQNPFSNSDRAIRRYAEPDGTIRDYAEDRTGDEPMRTRRLDGRYEDEN